MPETSTRWMFVAPASAMLILVSDWVANSAGRVKVCMSSRTWLVDPFPCLLPAVKTLAVEVPLRELVDVFQRSSRMWLSP